MREYTEIELEVIERELMDSIDTTLKCIENKTDLLDMLIDSLSSRLEENE